MASAKANKKGASAAVELPECPVCLETMSTPIYQCSSGHSLCSGCTQNLCPAICPMCRQPMTQMRNWQLEEIILKAKVPCPNKSLGCVYTMNSADVEDHLTECIFREMECPLGAVFGRCSWNGRLREMLAHFQERHPTHCNITSDAEVELEHVDINEDERYVYLIVQGKLHFILTAKVDTLQKMAYWTVQLIGGKKTAHQHIYEIHVTSKQDSRRKASFIEHCFNDAIKADEVFRRNKCAVLPLQSLKHFIVDKKLSFRFFIKKVAHINKENKGRKGNENNSPNAPGPNFNNPGPNMGGPGPNMGGPGRNRGGPGPNRGGPGPNRGPGPNKCGPGPTRNGPGPNVSGGNRGQGPKGPFQNKFNRAQEN